MISGTNVRCLADVPVREFTTTGLEGHVTKSTLVIVVEYLRRSTVVRRNFCTCCAWTDCNSTVKCMRLVTMKK